MFVPAGTLKRKALSVFACAAFLNLILSGCSGGGNDVLPQAFDPSIGTFAGTDVCMTRTNARGETEIRSQTLLVKYEIQVVDENGSPVPKMNVDYFEVDGNSVIYAFDPSGQHTSALVMGHPDDIVPADVTRTARHVAVTRHEEPVPPPVPVEPQFLGLLTVGLVLAIATITYAEIQIIGDAYEIGAFYITDNAVAGNGWILNCKTWDQIAELIAARLDIGLSAGSILIDFISAGTASSAIEIFGNAAMGGTQDIRDRLLQKAIVDGWGRSMAELEGMPVGVQIFQVDDTEFAARARRLFAAFRIHQEHPICMVVTGDVTGTVVDATSADPLAGVTVELVGMEATFTELTDMNGQYSFSDVAAGDYTVVAVDTGYTAEERDVSVVEGEPLVVNFALSPTIVHSDAYRIVLSWAELPADLDSHLWTPSIGGVEHHVYFSEKGNEMSPPYAQLDVDDTSSYGPETITIFQSFAGTYRYAVHNFSGGENGLTFSEASVRLYDSLGLREEWHVPNVGDGLWWNVFELDGASGIVNSVNTITD